MTTCRAHTIEHVIEVCRAHHSFTSAAKVLELSTKRVCQIARVHAPELFKDRPQKRRKKHNYAAMVETFKATMSIRATAREHNANVEWTRQILMRFAPETFARRQAPGFARA